MCALSLLVMIKFTCHLKKKKKRRNLQTVYQCIRQVRVILPREVLSRVSNYVMCRIEMYGLIKSLQECIGSCATTCFGKEIYKIYLQNHRELAPSQTLDPGY